MCRTTPEKEVEIGGYSPNRGNIWPVVEYLPLKQGLKLAIANRIQNSSEFAKYLPIKQGLKPFLVFQLR